MIFDDRICLLGEGPLWHPTRHELLWFDILGKALHTKTQSWGFDEYVSAAGWVDTGSIVLASASALHHFDLTTSKAETLCPLEADNPLTRSNDGRADPYGGFWIGTMGINGEDGAGAIYRYYRGQLRALYSPITISNAICFSPDGGHAYFTDTPTQKIMRVALDSLGWPKGDPALWLDLSGTDWRPDGAVVDAAGNLWNAQWGANRVACYDPNGTFIEAVAFGASQTSCPAFGGENLQTLFCTSAAIGLPNPNAHDGKTFATQLTHTGQPEHQVIL